MLNIAKQIYSGWNTTGVKHDLPEAEVIPFGKSSNEKKRLEAITKRYTILKEHDNIPLPGFTLYKNERKNYGSADPTWLVIDPRGYLVRITNDNLEDILHVTGITEGLIQQKCVWARKDSQTKMILVPTSSPLYLEAHNNTELIEGRVDMKDIQIGDKVLLQNELKGTFMGVLSLYGPLDKYKEIHKPQVFLRRQIVEVAPDKYYYQSDLKILKVIEKANSPLTRDESAELLNFKIRENKIQFSNTTHFPTSGYYSTRGEIKHVSPHAVPKLTMSFEEITLTDAQELFNYAASAGDQGILLIEDTKGHQYLIEFPYSFLSKKISKDSFEVIKVQKVVDGIEQIKDVEGPNPRHRSYTGTGTKELHALDKFAKFYKIIKHVKKESYV